MAADKAQFLCNTYLMSKNEIVQRKKDWRATTIRLPAQLQQGGTEICTTRILEDLLLSVLRSHYFYSRFQS